MLTLADSRRLPDATVYRDVSWADGTRSVTSQFYVLADEPVLAPAAGYTFYRYRGAPGSAEGGGLLVLAAGLPVPQAATEAVRAAYGLTPDAEVRVATPPVSAAVARVALAGESAAGDFVTSVACSTDASRGGVAVVCVLTAEGVALVDQAMEHGLAPVHLELDLSIPFVLDDLELTVWCDALAAGPVARDLAAAGEGGPDAVVNELLARHLAGTSVVTARALSDDEQAAVDALSAQVLAGVVLPALSDTDGAPRPWSQELASRATLTLTASTPGLLSVSRSANLALPDGPDHTVSADLGGAGLRRSIRVSAAGDLAARGIGVVEVSLDYAGTLPDGSALRRTADVQLRPESPAAATVFDIATPDQRSVTAHAVVHYADGSGPYAFDLADTAADEIVLDVDALGVVAVDVALVGADVVMRAVVDFVYGPEGSPVQGQCALDASQPTGRWVAIVREPPAAYRYRVTWVDGNARSPGDWVTGAGQRLLLVPPVAPPSGTVTVISAGGFDQLSALLVELWAADGQPVTTLRFSAPDQTQEWAVTPGGRYEYRTTLLRPDGSHTAGPSGSTDQPVLVVRDTLRYDVIVVPVLLGVGTTVTRALVELESPDPAAPHTTLVFDPPAAPARTSLRLADPAAHDYRFRLTLCPPSQPPTVGDWQSGSSSVLVPGRAS